MTGIVCSSCCSSMPPKGRKREVGQDNSLTGPPAATHNTAPVVVEMRVELVLSGCQVIGQLRKEELGYGAGAAHADHGVPSTERSTAMIFVTTVSTSSADPMG